MKRIYIVLLFIGFATATTAQDAIDYQVPPKSIYDLVMAPPTPGVQVDSKGKWMVINERSSMPTVEDLAQPELRIAGLRINPKNFGPSRSGYSTGITLKDIATGKTYPVKGLPPNLKAGSFSWSPGETKLGFTNTTGSSIDIYVVNIATQTATKWNKRPVNMVMGLEFQWLDDNTFLYAAVNRPLAQLPPQPSAPKGPVVQQNLGKVSAARTYQDLIKSPYDETLFEFYATTQIIKNNMGKETAIGQPMICGRLDISPDKHFLLSQRIDKPFSYLVPSNGFNSTILITDITGKVLKQLAKLPSSEQAPTGFDNVLNAPRSFRWKADEPATAYWITPLDSGMIKSKTEYHDAAWLLPAPFTGEPKLLTRTTMRMSGISSTDGGKVLVTEGLFGKRKTKTTLLDPATGTTRVLFERSTDDAYSNPGTPVTAENAYGRNQVKLIDGSKLLLSGTGASPKGDLPFLNLYDINTQATTELWRCEEPYYETIVKVLDPEKLEIFTSRQSQTEAPNYYLRDLKLKSTKAITSFPDPQPGLRGVTQQKITYKRKDGIDLAADLYLPAGYDAKKDGPLPVFMWAYPREFKNATDAAQVRGSKYMFTRVGYGSPIFWVTMGYAVMDNTEFPIVGEGENNPNDNFIEQLTWNAEAAIRKVAEMGVGDSTRVAVGGHSYGAFMTANLLAHTNLFKAGIARSGAYNRTLTPFGFQNEERTYWQAPEVYNRMSPFSYADKLKTPLLLIHGEADNNSGTFPIQSERLYNAIKGHGGTVRYVQLPFESHGYAAKENILHMLWEMTQWMEKYVKGVKPYVK